ncbi:MAG: GvpL/GvpF family gas vesicle protein, partial [Candidatus Methylomirabilales bacterium]
MKKEGTQIHGIIGARGPHRPTSLVGGNGESEIYTIPYKYTQAVVRRAEQWDYGSLAKEELLRRLAVHQSVIEKVMVDYAVLPMKFGTFAKDDEEVVRILQSGYPWLRRTLAAVADKIEIDVVAIWEDLGPIFGAIGEEDRIRELKERIGGKPAAETQEERVQLGKMVKASLEARRARCREDILSVLTSPSLTRDHRVNDVMDDSMIMNVAFLMDRHQEEAFDARVKALDHRFDGSIHFRCVGPLPPYSFSTLEVSRIPSEEVKAACEILGVSEGASLAHVKAAHRRLAR